MDRKEILACLTIACLLSACSTSRPIVVGSKNFTEQLILGEIIAQQLENRLKQKVSRKLNLGGTLLAHQSLVSGQIDLYPEYTGTALTTVLKLPPSSDAATVLGQVRSEYRSRWNIEWLDPLGFNNVFAMVIRGADARASHVQTLTQAANYKNGWRLGVGYEFLQRPDGLAGLMKAYRLPLKGSAKSMDLGLLYKALEQDQVDMVAGNATDGVLSRLDFKLLADDKRYFPPYEAAVAVRGASVAAHPGMREALAELSGKLSDQTMQKLNYQMDGEHRSLREVAQSFLQATR
jgi:osmoprotectant transport system substrate-binding protein